MIAVRFRFPPGRESRYVDMLLPAVPREGEQIVIQDGSFIASSVCWELDHPHLQFDSDRQFVVEPNVTVQLA